MKIENHIAKKAFGITSNFLTKTLTKNLSPIFSLKPFLKAYLLTKTAPHFYKIGSTFC